MLLDFTPRLILSMSMRESCHFSCCSPRKHPLISTFFSHQHPRPRLSPCELLTATVLHCVLEIAELLLMLLFPRIQLFITFSNRFEAVVRIKDIKLMVGKKMRCQQHTWGLCHINWFCFLICWKLRLVAQTCLLFFDLFHFPYFYLQLLNPGYVVIKRVIHLYL